MGTNSLLKRLGFIWPMLAFAVPMLAYLFTLAPGLTWANNSADGGDLITAAVTLGVPHPSGYPTYTLLGWLVSKLPFGAVAWRFNLLSAVSVAGACGLAYKIVSQLTSQRAAGLVSAWSLAFVPLVWSQAIVAEVYGLNLFFTGLLLWLAVQIWHGKTGYHFWLGLAFGLSLGVHLTNVFLLPLLIWLIVKSRAYTSKRNSFLTFNFSFLIGLLIFAYLPLRAGQGAITWGQPDTFGGFLALISGRIYQPYVFALPGTLVGPRLLALSQFLLQMGIFGLILTGLGLRWMWLQEKGFAGWSLVSMGGYIFYALGYNSVDSFVYLLPVFFILALYAGFGAAELIALASGHKWKSALIAGLLVIPLLQGILLAPDISLKNDATPEQFYQSALAQAPQNAVILSADERHTFSLWYAQHVLKLRPDAIVVDTRLVAFPWYQTDLLRQTPDLTQLSQLKNIFEQRGSYHRPLCVAFAGETENTWKLKCLE